MAALAGITEDQASDLLWRWDFWGRPEQQEPEGEWSIWLALAGRGFGKALAIDTPVPTPSGWSTMGQLQDGDKVFDECGVVRSVVKAHNVMLGRECFRVKFSDRSEIIADGDHLWTTVDRRLRKAMSRRIEGASSTKRQCQIKYRPQTLRTREIAASLYDGKEVNHCIPCAAPLVLPEADLLIDPYLLGLWLGDGSTKGAEITTADAETVQAFEGSGYVLKAYSQSGASKVYGINSAETNARRCGTTGQYLPGATGFKADLAALGLLGNKHVPQVYLRASKDQRMALLQGLFDTDGHCDRITGSSEFCSTDEGLARDVRDLALSLGMKAVTYHGRATINGRDCGPKYRVCFTAHGDFPLFRLSRKLASMPKRGAQAERAYRRYIVSVEPVPSVPVRCITVDSPSRLYLAGEAMIATHNTRMGSEWVRKIVCGPTPLAPGRCRRIALIAETAADARDVLVRGESGILSVHPPEFRPLYEPSKRLLTWPNGAEALLFNAVEPDQLRGPQFDAAWSDELAKWRYAQETWDNLQFGLRLGDDPRQMITTTPRPIQTLKQIINEPGVVITKGSTYDNKSNLAAKFIKRIEERYSGTRLGRQELEAEVLDDSPDSLWQRKQIDAERISFKDGRNYYKDKPFKLPDMRRVVVAIDPAARAGGEGESGGGAETGIIVAGLGVDGRGYILDDVTCSLDPNGWASRAVAAYTRHDADVIVAEKNQGGDMVQAVIRSVSPKVPIITVHASRGKVTRAEPIAALYAQGRVSHIGAFSQLEDQMVVFTPFGIDGGTTGDRVDALVWALTQLFPNMVSYKPIVATSEKSDRWDRAFKRSQTVNDWKVK